MPPRTFHCVAYTALRVSLSVVFVWFGLLKLFGVSSVFDIISAAYPIITAHKFLYLSLAILEIAVGIGILTKKFAVVSCWLMAGLLAATIGVLFSPLAFMGNFPSLSLAGEFIIKNLVLLSAVMVLISHDRELGATASASRPD